MRGINVSAFETSSEADLVDALRDQARPIISLVAEVFGNSEGKIVGHIMFSPVTLDGSHELKIMGLAPMSVLPERQGNGIGSELVREGLVKCKQLGFTVVVVLGHPEYYPRFGFSPSSELGIKCAYDVPEEMFMVIALQPQALSRKSGLVKYHAAFSNL